MREDHMEKMDALFPLGYVVVYACPDGFIRMTAFNPDKHPSLDNVRHNIQMAALKMEDDE